jgi:hypothetical protein
MSDGYGTRASTAHAHITNWFAEEGSAGITDERCHTFHLGEDNETVICRAVRDGYITDDERASNSFLRDLGGQDGQNLLRARAMWLANHVRWEANDEKLLGYFRELISIAQSTSFTSEMKQNISNHLAAFLDVDSETDPTLRLAALQAISFLSHIDWTDAQTQKLRESITPQVLAAVGNENPRVSNEAKDLIRKMFAQDVDRFAICERMLSHPDAQVRKGAVASLYISARHNEIGEWLFPFMMDPDPSVGNEALLEIIGHRVAVDTPTSASEGEAIDIASKLKTYLSDAPHSFQEADFKERFPVLYDHQDQVTPMLWQVVKDQRHGMHVRSRALKALAAFQRTHEGIPLLMDMARDTDEDMDIRILAMEEIIIFRDDDDVVSLLTKLAHDEPEGDWKNRMVRNQAEQLLRGSLAKSARAAWLADHAKTFWYRWDESAETRRGYLRELISIARSRSFSPEIKQGISDNLVELMNDRSETDPALHVGAMQALAAIGDAHRIDPSMLTYLGTFADAAIIKDALGLQGTAAMLAPIAQIDPEQPETFVNLLGAFNFALSQPETQLQALSSLSRIDWTDAQTRGLRESITPKVLATADDGDPRIVQEVSKLIRRMYAQDEERLALFERMNTHPDEGVRKEVRIISSIERAAKEHATAMR